MEKARSSTCSNSCCTSSKRAWKLNAAAISVERHTKSSSSRVLHLDFRPGASRHPPFDRLFSNLSKQAAEVRRSGCQLGELQWPQCLAQGSPQGVKAYCKRHAFSTQTAGLLGPESLMNAVEALLAGRFPPGGSFRLLRRLQPAALQRPALSRSRGR